MTKHPIVVRYWHSDGYVTQHLTDSIERALKDIDHRKDVLDDVVKIVIDRTGDPDE